MRLATCSTAFSEVEGGKINMYLLTDWEGRTGKYLARGQGVRTSLRSVRTSWPRAKYFPVRPDLKALANEDTLLRTHCCRHIVADTNVSPCARSRNICCRHKFCVRDTKNVSHFVQKHFVSATNVSKFAQPKKHHGQQCVRNNVSSFTRAFTQSISILLYDHLLLKIFKILFEPK